MILITGATGKLGRQVIETLLTKRPAEEIAALVRDEAKATELRNKGIHLRMGDYDDINSLNRAMEGVEKVLLISGGGASNGLQQHQNVVDAAKRAGVACIAYTSRCMEDRHSLANDLMKRHFQTEDYIRESGLNYIMFRNILYMDSMVDLMGRQVLDNGINLPAGNGKVSYALRADMGEAIGKVLAGNDCSNRVYHFTNVETYTFSDVADALTELAGRPVRYNAMDVATYQAQARQQGVPEFLIGMTIGFMTDIQNGQEETVSHELEQVLGRKPLSLKEGLKTIFGHRFTQ